MSAYVFANFDVTDTEAFADYVAHAPATVAAHGGEYLARGGTSQAWEGDLPVRRVVILRFSSVEHAQAWYHSPEYRDLRDRRQRAATGPLILTAGLDEL